MHRLPIVGRIHRATFGRGNLLGTKSRGGAARQSLFAGGKDVDASESFQQMKPCRGKKVMR